MSAGMVSALSLVQPGYFTSEEEYLAHWTLSMLPSPHGSSALLYPVNMLPQGSPMLWIGTCVTWRNSML